ncbi:MAG: NADH:flavin oxidoreductase [Alphaproteobacteria bacterium]|nr:NADH:flavin oxidoreductase [Alphaproteobacteria bacterium]MBU6473317.1 NADH:flavin oxidoreductase [Alphaproteobacteria bacterium]MDE2012361.1 NADH:flavin oxidoreductase [Alphaproteobacteria bacterium]MDE2074308.1 NADH:flavin oxidoreductase [Alphaproteobacteria bacterium]
MQSPDALFRPFRLKSLDLPNRIVMAPMTRSKSPGQVPGPEVAAYYRRRAAGGVGLIITEGVGVEHPSATNDVAIPLMWREDALKGWAAVVKAVKAADGHIMPQLWHQGIMRRAGTGPYPEAPSMSPSGLVVPGGKPVAAPMSQKDIDAVVEGFAKSAANAKALGFDGVEIHGAHGYLIDQFFWEGTNQRTDSYGGSIEARTKLACEIVAAVRAATGPDFPILLRYSQWKQQDFTARLAHNPAELERFLSPMVKAGVDMFHASTRRFWEPEFPELDKELNLAGWTKKITGLPAMTVGSVSLNDDFIVAFIQKGTETSEAHLDTLLKMLDRGDFDMVAIGRALIVNPDWADKIRAGHFDRLVPYDPKALAELV